MNDDEERYVHEPEGASSTPASPGDEFGWRGRSLLVGILIAFVVVPLIVYFRPPGVPFVVAYLILPLVPAVLLALLAVWATT